MIRAWDETLAGEHIVHALKEPMRKLTMCGEQAEEMHVTLSDVTCKRCLKELKKGGII